MGSRGDVLRRALHDGRTAVVVATDRHDGDVRVDGEPALLAARRRAIVPLPWTWLRQVHGSEVVEVARPGEHAGAEADALVTTVSGAAIAVQTADCAPVAFVAEEGVVGVAHAGWRGLEAGVLDATLAAMRRQGAQVIDAYLGPCIHAECYEFGPDDLARLCRALGPEVAGTTRDGAPALDLPAAVRNILAANGVDRLTIDPVCTACADDAFSHRARGDTGRQSMVAWIEP